MTQSFITKIPTDEEILETDPGGRLIAEIWYQDRRGGGYTVSLTLHEKGLGRLFVLHDSLLPEKGFHSPWEARKALIEAYEAWLNSRDNFPLDFEVRYTV